MLIVHVITRLLRAGSEENTISTALAQARAGNEVLLLHGSECTPGHRETYGSYIRFVEIKDLVHAISPISDFKAVCAMRSLFEEVRPTVVHTHQSKAGILGRIAARLARVPTIVHGVHILPFVGVGIGQKMAYLAAERAMAWFTHAFINVSDGTRRTCLNFGIGRPEQHFVVPSGFDLPKFQRASWPSNWQDLVGADDPSVKPPLVLMLAAFEPRKRHVAFLESLAQVTNRAPSMRLLLAGEGPTRPLVEAKITSLGLSRHVRLLGFHAHPEQLIALSDLTVLTSMREGLPRVMMQSLAGGKPVVTTDLPGISDLVHSGVNGIIREADDVAGAAATVVALLNDPAKLHRLQKGAAATDLSSWSVDSMCTGVSNVYQRVTIQNGRTVCPH